MIDDGGWARRFNGEDRTELDSWPQSQCILVPSVGHKARVRIIG